MHDYNSRMRRKSAVSDWKEAQRIEQARRMTPEQRLEASADLHVLVMELHRAGNRYREERKAAHEDHRSKPGRSIPPRRN